MGARSVGCGGNVIALELFQRAGSYGKSTALLCAGRAWAYSDLLEASAAVGSSLLDGANDLDEARIAFFVPAGFDYVAVQWGVWRAGGIAVPLNVAAAEPEIEHVLVDAEISVLVVLRALRGRVGPLCGRLGIEVMDLEDALNVEPAPLPEVSADRRAMMLYTSGTTSKPKGVVTTHANTEAQVRSLVDGWFKTGDLAVLENSYYRILGRLSVDIIKSGGYKLSALEIEDELRQHPAIRECSVVGVADDTWGEAVAVAAEIHEGMELELHALRGWASDRLSKYKLPVRLEVVECLPRNAMGKVTKPAVRTLFER